MLDKGEMMIYKKPVHIDWNLKIQESHGINLHVKKDFTIDYEIGVKFGSILYLILEHSSSHV